MRKQRLWYRLSRRFIWGLVVAFVIVFAPCPAWTPDLFMWWQVPAGVLFFILYVGVVLFDTLFFDRYH